MKVRGGYVTQVCSYHVQSRKHYRAQWDYHVPCAKPRRAVSSVESTEPHSKKKYDSLSDAQLDTYTLVPNPFLL